MGFDAWFAIAVFVVTYGFIVSEKIHRTIIALVGAGIVILTGLLTQEQALGHIDWNTLALLTGMMLLVGVLRGSGLFEFLGVWVAKVSRGRPKLLLFLLAAMTAVLSAFLDNVTTVLLLVPVTLAMTDRLRLPAFPYLIAEIISSNLGGTATLIGDPPNIMIGSAVGLDFMDFVTNIGDAVFVILLLTIGLLLLLFGRELHTDVEATQALADLSPKDEVKDRALLLKGVIVLGLTIVGFVLHGQLHLESATIAFAGAALMLLLGGAQRMGEAFHHVEWPTLFFFIGLFVLVGGLVETGVIVRLASWALGVTGGSVPLLTVVVLWLSGFASAFVDNIPFTATMIPLLQQIGTQLGEETMMPVWWALSLGACFGGNGTLVGASANLIVASLAERQGITITFGRYFRYGFPVTLVTLLLSTGYLLLFEL
ncbi:MAG: ArsB/NhaD family transporter [Firmicutes bacterium]|nr:ArsB/NhaD family transporter [Bacillota bacterium]